MGCRRLEMADKIITKDYEISLTGVDADFLAIHNIHTNKLVLLSSIKRIVDVGRAANKKEIELWKEAQK